MKNKVLQGVLLGVCGVLLFSTKAVMVKMAYLYDVDVISLLVLRMGFALPVYLFMLALSFLGGQKNKIFTQLGSKDWVALLALGTVGYYLASWLDFKGLERIDASLERLILFVYPTFVLLLSRLFFKKEIKSNQIAAIIICYVGVFVMFAGDLFNDDLKTDWIGVLFVVGSGLTYALYLVGSQGMMRKISPKDFTNIAMIISCACVLLHFYVTSEVNILNLDWQVYLIGFMMAIFATVIPSYFISISINAIGASRLAIIGCLGPVSTISLAMLFLDETLSLEQVIGAIVIVGTVVWINLSKS